MPEQETDQTEATILVARPARAKPLVTRRRLLLAGFWSGLLFAPLGVLGSLLNFVYPRRVGAFGGPFVVPAKEVPEAGADPVRFPMGRFYLSHLAPGQEGSPGGLLALYQKCTHLGCTVPWRPDFVFQGDKGWFRCPCHGSTFTSGAAIRVFGPAPRPLDTMALEVKENGDVVVDTGAVAVGSDDNPQRTVPYDQPAAAAATSKAAGRRA